jgi:hypothetical protein
MSFESLPNEIILNIFNYVVASDENVPAHIGAIREVCTLFNDIMLMHPYMRSLQQIKNSKDRILQRILHNYMHNRIIYEASLELNKVMNEISLSYENHEEDFLKKCNGFIHRPSSIINGVVHVMVRPRYRKSCWSWGLDFSLHYPRILDVTLVVVNVDLNKILLKQDISKYNKELNITSLKLALLSTDITYKYTHSILSLAHDIEDKLLACIAAKRFFH